MNSELDTNNMGLRPHVALWRTTRFELDLSQPRVMGILNLTPDSFSNNGQLATDTQALAHAEKMVDAGASILDIGGESTRPGACALTHEQEWHRISGVLKQLIKWNVPLSVDTYHPQTMAKALDLGGLQLHWSWLLIRQVLKGLTKESDESSKGEVDLERYNLHVDEDDAERSRMLHPKTAL